MQLIMKKLILITGFLIIALSAKLFAQQDDPSRSLDTVFMKKFSGTWLWKSGQESFTLVLKLQSITPQDPKGEIYFLHGWVKYVKNGITIFDDIGKGQAQSTITAFSLKGESILKCQFNDKTRQKTKSATLKFADENHDSILLNVENDNFFKEMHSRKPISSNSDTLPQQLHITLRKVN